MEGWQIGLVGNIVIALSYFAIAGAIGWRLSRENQWGSNPLATATALVFLTCAGGHTMHAIHLAEPGFGILDVGMAVRFEYALTHMWGWDMVSAGVGVWYWTLRAKFPALVRGTRLFEDVRVRQRRALQIHDDIVQGLAQAKLALELQDERLGDETLDQTLSKAKGIISDLLGKDGVKARGRPGGLRRREGGDD